MKILLLGATGMAGTAIKRELRLRKADVIGVSRSNSELCCDLCDENQIANMLMSVECDAIINAAAQVDVNSCEIDPLSSWKINAKIVSILANFSLNFDKPLLQISTDHYYPYGGTRAHRECDPVYCVNEYARHKFAGEQFALVSPNSLVLRTSFLGVRDGGRKSLLQWAIASISDREPIELFNDAWTSSIDVNSFARFALDLFLDINHRGLLNLSAGEVYSKEKLIRKVADLLHLDHGMCTSRSVTGSLNRPTCLGLDVSAAESLLKIKLPKLDQVCSNLVKENLLDKV